MMPRPSCKFQILPCELADLAACADIFQDAFAGDPYFKYLHPRSDPAALRARALRWYEESFVAPGTRFFKAVDEETGCVECLSLFFFFHNGT